MLTFSERFTVAKERQQKKQGTQEVCTADDTCNLQRRWRKKIYVKKHLHETLETQKRPRNRNSAIC